MTKEQYLKDRYSTSVKQKKSITFSSIIKKATFLSLIVCGLISPISVHAQDSFPVPLILADRIDRSSATWPWVYIGNKTQIVDRIENTIGCAGTYSNGAPARVRCYSRGYILSPGYSCPADIRDLHVGETVIGQLGKLTRATSYSDGHNPDSCEKTQLGNTPVRTRSYQLYLAGARWNCPSGYPPVDIDGDGDKYGGEEFPYIYNPEACGRYECPVDSIQTHRPSDPNANSTGYVCVGANPVKQSNSCSANNPNPKIGNPIIVASGNKHQTEPDYQSNSPLGLSFTRFYNSTAANVNTGVGKKWRHNYALRVDRTGNYALAYRSNGQVFTFNYDGMRWQGDVDIPDTLVERFDVNNDHAGWIYTTLNDTVELYNSKGQLTQVTNRQGQSKALFYDLPSKEGGDDNGSTLDKVTDFTGETLLLAYDTTQRINRMTDPQGQNYHYAYSTSGNLSRVTYPDNTPGDDSDNPIRHYHYEDSNHPHGLTGITDETGTRYVTWVYDVQGRAISSELAGGVEKETLVYHDDDSMTVTNPLGKQTTYKFTTLHSVKKVTGVTGHATASCAGANKAYTYDVNGYLSSKTDWQGTTTAYQRDAKGRELSRTEAVGTYEERTITTEWHAQWNLPTRITEPGKVTAFTYDENGLLLSKLVKSLQYN